MPKFFNEVWLRDMSPKTMQGVVDFLGKLRVGVRPHNLPGDLQLLAVRGCPTKRRKCIHLRDRRSHRNV